MGDAATSMIASAITLAATMISMCGTMPTAVITESSENTMSITMICSTTNTRPRCAARLLVIMSAFSFSSSL